MRYKQERGTVSITRPRDIAPADARANVLKMMEDFEDLPDKGRDETEAVMGEVFKKYSKPTA